MSMILYLRRASEAEVRKLAQDEDAFYEFLFDETAQADGDLIDFDKAWHALHFMLTGSAWEGEGPLAFLLAPWPEVGEDTGYGPPRLAPPEQVRAFRDAFAGISEEELKRRYDPQAMVREEIYVADALANEGESGWDYVAQGLPGLRRFADRCVETSSSVLIVIS